ncbi:MAG TPA: M1 family metallopeptidase [Gemmatimonadales bacterium]|nr:M1 family metallopeptidase [Gemmatimonadales bacterium]
MLPLLIAVTAAVLQDSQTSHYWQQQVAYTVDASLDEATGVLTAHERIVYVNHSPDTLRDFYVHDYLNAFRPGSRWAAYDSASGVVRYQHMQDPDYAFERITKATVMGAAGTPDYPYAPDSTIAHWALPHALPPGGQMTVEIDWQARLSTLPRRQGRDPKTRRYDFAQWYPKVVVYDQYGWEDHPLYPPGEFYGEFGTFDVTLDLPSDQVVGATGVPVCGDPGWDHANANAVVDSVDYQRGYYAGAPHDCPPAAAGRKMVRFVARDVHHFAFTLNPHYIYEQGRFKDVIVHVLYQPQDKATWGNGIAVKRTETALQWLDATYGKYQWPQLTNVHRIEGGGTEFPMMIMDGGPDQGLILHEGGHMYTMGQLANNEWREGYLDEGFTSFQTGWYFETHGGRPSYDGLDGLFTSLDLDGWSEPVSMVSERYRDFDTYNLMIYNRGQFFYEELRYIVGDATMHKILRTYFDRWKLKHVDEDRFRAVCEEVYGHDLGWFFGQWLHGVPIFDYKLANVERTRLPGGKWRTVVTIQRLGDGWLPVEIGDKDTMYARATGQPETERVEFVSAKKPGRLKLDPRLRTHDWNYLNNYESKFLEGHQATKLVFDDPTRTVTRRDSLVQAYRPQVWYNDLGGLVVSLHANQNYFGLFDRGASDLSRETGRDASHPWGFEFSLANPTGLQHARQTTTLSAWDVEGRAGASLRWDHTLIKSPFQPFSDPGSDPHAGFDIQWMSTTDVGYLDRRMWDDAGTIELGPWYSNVARQGRTLWTTDLGVKGGVVYRVPGPGVISQNRYDVNAYARVTGQGSVRTPFVGGAFLGVRLFGGAYFSPNAPPLQRRIYVGGADPYTTFTDPLLRSRGAWFVRPGFYYQAPGDGNLRGFSSTLGGRWVVTTNIELTHSLLTRHAGFMRNTTFEAFFDGGLVDTMAVLSASGTSAMTTLWDGGAGLVFQTAIRQLAWTTRFEVPFLVNRFDKARDVRSGGNTAFRWSVSLAPSF